MKCEEREGKEMEDFQFPIHISDYATVKTKIGVWGVKFLCFRSSSVF